MTSPRRSGLVLGMMAALTLLAGTSRAGDEAPLPIPYGTQQSFKLKALVDAAPFMAKDDDDVKTLMQERLRVCVSLFETQAERIDLGRVQLDALAEPMAEVKLAWIALCVSEEQKMPILKYALQLADHREKVAEAMQSAGQGSSVEALKAKRDRLGAEIELAQCQRNSNRQDASAR